MLQGYILEDESGILGIVPFSQPTSKGRTMAMEYIRKNKVLEVIDAKPDEDWYDLSERVQKRVKELLEKTRLQIN